MDRSTRLTPNFTLGELTTTSRTSLADTNFREALAFIEPIQATAEMLQVVRDRWGRLKVNSGFRGKALNAAIGGSKTSQHLKGEAVDFVPLDASLEEVFWWIVEESGLPFGQVILENDVWIHLSLGPPYRPASKSGQALTWNKREGYRVAIKG